MWNGFSDELHCKLDVKYQSTGVGGWGRERFVGLENGHFASICNYQMYLIVVIKLINIKLTLSLNGFPQYKSIQQQLYKSKRWYAQVMTYLCLSNLKSPIKVRRSMLLMLSRQCTTYFSYTACYDWISFILRRYHYQDTIIKIPLSTPTIAEELGYQA